MFNELVNRNSCKTVLRAKEMEQTWEIFKDIFHRVQGLLICRFKKPGKGSKSLA